MKGTIAILLVTCGLLAVKTQSQEAAPLKLAQTYKLSADVKGNFDHFAIDLAGNRLFATPEAYKAVLVFDLKTGNMIHKISGIEKPHAILFREDLKRLYVTDGEAGDVSVYQQASADNYKLLGKVPTGPLARTALLVPQLNRYFVAVPQHGTTNAEIQVFEVH